MWVSRLASIAAFAVGAAAAVYAAGPPLGSGPLVPLALEARAVPLNAADPAAERVGRLRYLGGLELRASDRRFGGISALLWEPRCNRLLAATDSGAFILLSPTEEAGRLTGIESASIAPILTPSGRPPLSKRDADAEALARDSSGATWVFYEQDHRGERFPRLSACDPASFAEAPDSRWAPPGAKGWPANGGIEAAAFADGRFLLLSESMAAPAGLAALATRPDGAEQPFAFAAVPGHEPTALDPDGAGGNHLVLHRFFSPLTGVSIVLAEADFPAAAPGLVTARELARLAPPFTIDNMEGMAVRMEGGRRMIYLVSDDNFNPLQRTLLMKFELLPAEAS